MKPDGRRVVWGGRRHNCFSSASYRALADRMTRTMAQRYATHPAVVGWQIDNELGDNIGGTDCRCEQCRARFQDWLRTKYETIVSLNQAWGNHFWGVDNWRVGKKSRSPIAVLAVGPSAIPVPRWTGSDLRPSWLSTSSTIKFVSSANPHHRNISSRTI